MSATAQVEATIETLVSKALGAGVELEGLQKALQNALARVEVAQADALNASNPKRPDGAPSKRGSGVPKSDEDIAFSTDMNLGPEEFAMLAREREGAGVSDEHIASIFKAFDTDGSGTVSAHEYLLYSLAAALTAMQLRAYDLFKQWDEDNSGKIDEAEFVQACTVLGFAVPSKVAKKLFRELDVDKSGTLEYKELGLALNKRAGQALTKQELLRYTPGGQQANRDNRLGKVVARDSLNYASVRVRALPAEATIDATSTLSVSEQIGMLLTIHSKTLIQLFLDWDEDGNGGINKKEFHRAITGLGYVAPKKAMDALFDKMDTDKDNWLSYAELKKGISKYIGQKRVDTGRPITSEGRMRGSSSKGSLGSSGSTGSLGLTEKFKYSWAQDHSARWPYESYPNQRALQMSLIRPPTANAYSGLLRQN